MATASAAAINSTSLSCDLRDWLKDVKRLEQLEQISGADWDLEIGADGNYSRKDFYSAGGDLR